MKVVVLGSGVIGVTSADYLASEGHDVVVIDRQPAPALETSFANAGEISPGYASPWAAPGVPRKALKWLFMRHAPLIVSARWDPALFRWMWAMLRECTSLHYAINKERMVRYFSIRVMGRLVGPWPAGPPMSLQLWSAAPSPPSIRPILRSIAMAVAPRMRVSG